MTPSTPDLKSLFLQALEQPPGLERSAYLDGACRGDGQLRGRIDELIEHYLRASECFGGATDVAAGVRSTDKAARPRGAVTVTCAAGLPTLPRAFDDGPGTQLGPYVLLQKIGEGGMGTVYMAEQEHPIRRKVALKVIKPGMDTDMVVARFEAERQALALMDHPSIARVFDAGATESGRPYFVMELVDGVPINRYCDQARLSMRERLSLFLPVCHAIQHAHQKGIIHRDIKPSNVLIALVDGQPVPKVIDFGVAKAVEQRLTEQTIETQFGMLVGTLEYMSPEQADFSGANIDTRSDIYALGVLLYELLTGTTPLGGARLREDALTEILRRIREEEPERPSTRLGGSGESLAAIAACRDIEPTGLTRMVRGDLDWIALKALEKDRSRRYATAVDLARDVQRYLDGDPVEACPPSTIYRFLKFSRKHQAALITASAFVAVLATTSAVSTWQAIRAREAERVSRLDARRARSAEAQARTEAENARRSASESEAVRKFLEHDLLAAARPEGQGGGLGREVTIRAAVDYARPGIAGAFTNQPTIEAAVRNTLGMTYHYLGDPVTAIPELERAVALRAKHLGPDHPDTLEGRGNLASAILDGGRTREAIAMMRETLALLTARLGPDHIQTLRARNDLGVAYRINGQTDEAIALHRETLRLKSAKFGPDGVETLESRNNLAQAYLAADRTDEAIAMHEETLRLRTAKLGPDHPDTLVSRNNLARAYEDRHRLADAIAMYKEALRLRIAKLGPDHLDTLHTRNNLGEAYRAAGRADEAIALHEETLRLRTAKLGPDHPGTLISRNNLANAYQAAGRTDEAIAMHEETLRLRTAKLGPDQPGTIISRHGLAVAYQVAGRTPEATAIWEAMLPAARKAFGPGHRNTLLFTNRLAAARELLGRWAAALPLRRELVAARRKASPDSTALANELGLLGTNLLRQGAWTEAEPVLRECLKLCEDRLPGTWTTSDVRSLLGRSLLGQRKYAAAEPLILSGYQGLKARQADIPAPAIASLAEAALGVVELYEACGKAELAARWRVDLGLADLPDDVFGR